jgi:hypothetical protein
MTADHARKIALAIENRDRAARNLDNAAKMPPRDETAADDDAMLSSAGAAYAEAQTTLDDLIRAQPVPMASLAPGATEGELEKAGHELSGAVTTTHTADADGRISPSAA